MTPRRQLTSVRLTLIRFLAPCQLVATKRAYIDLSGGGGGGRDYDVSFPESTVTGTS